MNRPNLQTFKSKASNLKTCIIVHLNNIDWKPPISIYNTACIIKDIIVMLIVSSLIVLTIDYLLTYILNNNLTPQSLRVGIYSSDDNNTRYILSALSQVQAAIFGIFFTLHLIIAQINVSSRAISPKSMREALFSTELKLIFIAFIISITLDLLLLRYIDSTTNINMFIPLTLFISVTLLLGSYMYRNVSRIFDNTIISEIVIGEPRPNLEGANLRGAWLVKPCLNFIDLSYAHLEHVNLWDASFEGSTLIGAYLEGSILVGANMVNTVLIQTHLENANLSWANMEGANMLGVYMEGANLEQANLMSANLNCAHLQNANLKCANLVGANLTVAHLNGANMDGALLKGTFLMTDFFDDAFVETLIKAKDLDKAVLAYGTLSEKLIIKIEELLKTQTTKTDIEYLDRILTALRDL